MYKQGYKTMAGLNFLLGVCAILLYTPYMLQAFDINASNWVKLGMDIFNENYFNVLVYFGMLLLVWILGVTIFSILARPNITKFMFKIAVIASLVLPLIYVLALKFDWAYDFWMKNLAEDIKTISYVFLIVACGSFFTGLLFNFSQKKKANFHHISQALVMCVLLVLFLAVNGWCGWELEVEFLTKVYGVLMGWFAIYLPISTFIIMASSKKRL